MAEGTAVTIRAARSADLTAVAEIYAHYVHHSVVTFELAAPEPQTWQARLDWCVERGLPFLVAEESGAGESGDIAGYAYCSPWLPRPAYRHTVQDSVYLAPGATGRGIGALLLDGLLRGCAGTDAREMLAVVVDTGEQASTALHKRHGFVEAGRLHGVGYKHGRWLDTLLLQRTLPQRTPQANLSTVDT